MYYKGTLEECQQYNAMVTNNSSYDGVYTVIWASVYSHPNGVDFAIRKHDKYSSDLTEIETLGADWFPEEDI